jgi:hypothetical protein
MILSRSPERMAEALMRAEAHWHRPESEKEVPCRTGPRFSIALSREAGADGARIARLVGEQLHWPVYDRELLERIAEGTGLRVRLLETVDEKRSNWLREFVENLSAGPAVSATSYIHHLGQTLLSLAAHGDCVIVGRAAPQVLPRETTLRVRVVADRADRVRVAMERFGMSEPEAARWVDRTDDERRHFVKDHFGKDPSDPHCYDLVLNSSRLSAADCAGLIIEALHRVRAAAGAPLPA